MPGEVCRYEATCKDRDIAEIAYPSSSRRKASVQANAIEIEMSQRAHFSAHERRRHKATMQISHEIGALSRTCREKKGAGTTTMQR
jgi:hypothetical protein